jgi:hypothetical protein
VLGAADNEGDVPDPEERRRRAREEIDRAFAGREAQQE